MLKVLVMQILLGVDLKCMNAQYLQRIKRKKKVAPKKKKKKKKERYCNIDRFNIADKIIEGRIKLS